MKVDIDRKQSFKPITLTIKLESREELESLIARLAIQTDVVNKELDENTYEREVTERATFNASYDLFNALHTYNNR